MNNQKLNYNCDEFSQWFVGFSDGEACFMIVPKKDKKNLKINRFIFMFSIGLHKDDKEALNYIKNRLGIGSIILTKNNECKFVVTDKESIKKLIIIFDKYNLNTTKYLDYSNFKKAYNLYFERKGGLTEELINEILKLKNNMNTSRTNFNMPSNHKIIITKYWLLGLLEGSFQLWRSDVIPVFSLVLTEKQLPVLEKIKEYLYNTLGFDKYSMEKLKYTSSIGITHQKARNNSKASVLLIIKNNHILHNYLIPHFDSLNFITKKGKDFSDFKIICKVVYYGAHRRDDIKNLILKLSYTMNNYRLSTYSGNKYILNNEEKDLLINATPTIEHLKDGRQRDLITKKIIHQHTSCIYEIIKPNKEVLLIQNLGEAAKIVGKDSRTLSKYLDKEILNSETSNIEFNKYKIKRIPVFYKN